MGQFYGANSLAGTSIILRDYPFNTTKEPAIIEAWFLKNQSLQIPFISQGQPVLPLLLWWFKS